MRAFIPEPARGWLHAVPVHICELSMKPESTQEVELRCGDMCMHEAGRAYRRKCSVVTCARMCPSREGDAYVLNGHKWWASGAMDPRCAVCIFMGKTDPGAPTHRQQSMVLVPMRAPGVTIGRPLTVFGYDDAPHGHAELLFQVEHLGCIPLHAHLLPWWLQHAGTIMAKLASMPAACCCVAGSAKKACWVAFMILQLCMP